MKDSYKSSKEAAREMRIVLGNIRTLDKVISQAQESFPEYEIVWSGLAYQTNEMKQSLVEDIRSIENM